MPGETFSYNKALGERTPAAGYKNAAVYENGKVVDGIGGGICQISSTLYNAVLKANLGIVERRNHQFVTSYIPAGQDATVVYGMTDFRFKNTRKYAVKIKASCSNGIATVSIYGIKEENEYSISFDTRTISTIPYTIKYEENKNLAAGTEKVSQVGANGVITETYLVKSLNGKIVSRTLLSKDTYNAMQRIIVRGTKGASTNNNNSNNNNNNTENNKPEEKPEEIKPPVEEKPEEIKPPIEENSSIENTNNRNIK
ncbi:vancomycin B-type resistance protein VanW [Thomasclavelia cocleata]|uniref:Vancomycin B-type resistance protein VanW n=2 Tax=Thomasclavelia cocleata TaxID=69824 RepID=A0A829ZAJ2_9FIRM|nr:vancomycin B-type resistance protein VanW [Thomasclavelia cocleata]